MYNSTEHRQSTGVAPSPGRGIFTAFGARHVKGVAVQPMDRRGLFRDRGRVGGGVRSLVGAGVLRGGRAERLARLPGPALECPEQRQALGVVSIWPG